MSAGSSVVLPLDYPEASYQRREEIIAEHRLYQQGLMWTLANHSRMPEHIRAEVAKWGLCKDEFQDGNGWQQQLYVREARRLVGDLVMTQHHCQGREIAQDSVGLAAYTMDSHHVRRHVTAQGFVNNEGDVQVGGFAPYPIGYLAIVPKQDQCSNLLIPVCLSASHIAFGSIRMEPVFMVLGQSAATAAAHAIDQQVPVQRIDRHKLQERLLADGMKLQWTGPRPSAPPVGVKANSLPGLVLDDHQAELRGFGRVGTSVSSFVGEAYRHDDNTEKGFQVATFPIRVAQTGRYEICLSYSPHPNRATNTPVIIQAADGSHTRHVNQRKKPSVDGLFESLGIFPLLKEQDFSITISNSHTDGYVIVDAIQILLEESGDDAN